jgi:hypothetical protein
MSILEAGKMYNLDTVWITKPDMNKKVNEFWKSVSAAKKSGAVWMPRYKEIEEIQNVMSGSAFPDFEYFLFDANGKRA